MKIVQWKLIYPIDTATPPFFAWAPAYQRGIKILIKLKAIEQERK